MSYADCVARISQLDTVVRGFDPNWLGIALIAVGAILVAYR